ncbi:hypothetical protein CAAN1_09S01838 [[Candida] anglica]|uniref:PA14 domain-containing protein n=1 Tax=[Candida] anglica TaxID=148631 RepID=A0ABP0EAS1_9ASCO
MAEGDSTYCPAPTSTTTSSSSTPTSTTSTYGACNVPTSALEVGFLYTEGTLDGSSVVQYEGYIGPIPADGTYLLLSITGSETSYVYFGDGVAFPCCSIDRSTPSTVNQDYLFKVEPNSSDYVALDLKAKQYYPVRALQLFPPGSTAKNSIGLVNPAAGGSQIPVVYLKTEGSYCPVFEPSSSSTTATSSTSMIMSSSVNTPSISTSNVQSSTNSVTITISSTSTTQSSVSSSSSKISSPQPSSTDTLSTISSILSSLSATSSRTSSTTTKSSSMPSSTSDIVLSSSSIIPSSPFTISTSSTISNSDSTSSVSFDSITTSSVRTSSAPNSSAPSGSIPTSSVSTSSVTTSSVPSVLPTAIPGGCNLGDTMKAFVPIRLPSSVFYNGYYLAPIDGYYTITLSSTFGEGFFYVGNGKAFNCCMDPSVSADNYLIATSDHSSGQAVVYFTGGQYYPVKLSISPADVVDVVIKGPDGSEVQLSDVSVWQTAEAGYCPPATTPVRSSSVPTSSVPTSSVPSVLPTAIPGGCNLGGTTQNFLTIPDFQSSTKLYNGYYLAPVSGYYTITFSTTIGSGHFYVGNGVAINCCMDPLIFKDGYLIATSDHSSGQGVVYFTGGQYYPVRVAISFDDVVDVVIEEPNGSEVQLSDVVLWPTAEAGYCPPATTPITSSYAPTSSVPTSSVPTSSVPTS